MDVFAAFQVIFVLWGKLRLMAAMGKRGRVRTQLLCKFEDESEMVLPFWTFEL